MVEAYWVGNDLLDEVDPEDLLATGARRFRGQLGGTWGEAGDRAVAHHSFHVFEVYPWAALLTGPGRRPAGRRCTYWTAAASAPGWCSASTADGDGGRSAPWCGRTGGSAPAPRRRSRCAGRWTAVSLIERTVPGDRVALHWDWVCDRLSPDQVDRVVEAERRQLLALAAGSGIPSSSPGPGA